MDVLISFRTLRTQIWFLSLLVHLPVSWDPWNRPIMIYIKRPEIGNDARECQRCLTSSTRIPAGLAERTCRIRIPSWCGSDTTGQSVRIAWRPEATQRTVYSSETRTGWIVPVPFKKYRKVHRTWFCPFTIYEIPCTRYSHQSPILSPPEPAFARLSRGHAVYSCTLSLCRRSP